MEEKKAIDQCDVGGILLSIIWFLFLVEILILTLIKPFITDFEVVSIIAVSTHIMLSTFLLITLKNKYRYLFLAAFLSRILIMLWDLFARSIFVLPNSGADSEMFYNSAVAISENIALFSFVRDLYPRLMGLLFYMIGPQRMTAHYLNVLLGLSTVVVIWKILVLLGITHRAIKLTLILAAFFPTSIIMSGIFLREILPTFFVAASLYWYLKWFKTSISLCALGSVLLLLIASAFHSGVISIFVGYAFGFLFYNHRKKEFKSSLKSVIVFLLIVVGTALIFTRYGNLFLAKFAGVENIELIYYKASSSAGGSAYLQGVSVSNIPQLLLFGPLRGFFFLTSPLPMDWRGVADIFSFITDSLLYITTIFLVIKYRRYYGQNKPLVIVLLIMIASAALIFGIGVGNAGTAMRHRQKLTPVFLTTLAVIMNSRRERLRIEIEEPSISRL